MSYDPPYPVLYSMHGSCSAGRAYNCHTRLSAQRIPLLVTHPPNCMPTPRTGYLRDYLHIPAEEVEEITLRLYLEHGTTMAGLVATGHVIDYDHFHSLVSWSGGWGG